METAIGTTRERRKRVHSTKCSCCSHEQGKPELKARQSRKRKGDESKTEGTPLLKTKRSSKPTKSKEVATAQSTDSNICSPDLKDENSTTERRVLRSGRSTPVSMEKIGSKEKSVSPKSVSQKSVSRKKPKVKKAIKQEGVKKLFKEEGVIDGDEVKSDLSGIKKEEDLNILTSTLSSKGKAKPKTRKQQGEGRKSGAAQGTGQQKEGKVTKIKGAPKNGKGITKSKHTQVAKTKGFNLPNIPKKTSAIEKLKVRAFDQLKEKLEIAFDQSSISVPECVKLLEQITSPNLSEIFYSQPVSVDEVNSDSLVSGLAGKSLPEIMTRAIENTEEKAATRESTVAENLSKAAQALVSFKTQSASQLSYEEFNTGTQNESNLTSAGFLDQQFVTTNMGNHFDGAISVPTQPVNNLSTMPAATQAKPVEEILKSPSVQSTTRLSSNSKQVLATSNLQAVNGLIANSAPIVKSNIPEPSAPGMSLSSPLVAVTNQYQQTANPLVPTTSQFLEMTKSTIATSTQVLSTVNQLIPPVNDLPLLTNPLIPTAKQLLQTNPIPTGSQNPLIQTTNQLFSSFPSVSAIQTTSGSKTDNTLVAISPNLLVNQPQLALQLLQTQRTTSSNITSVMTTTQTPETPQMCHNTTPNQQPTTLVTTPLNQRLLLPQITPPIDQKTLGSNLPTLLPDVKKPHDLLLPKVVTTAPPNTTGTRPTTSANEMPNLCKLRPILPREPLVPSTFTIFQPLQSLQQAAKPNDTSSNVKQAVKRLVSGRTKNTDYTSPKQTTSLPDIASTFNKGFFTASSPRNVGQMIAPAQNSELANKEQAIKALLSIGSEQQTVTQGNTNAAAGKEIEAKGPDDLLVVFDTDKGIFKVDDVTIDPQVNTIGKESYTCGKCGKIFTSLSYLARHIKRVCPDMTHRKWKCDHCDKAFRHPFGLQQHVFTHTGERPHKCSQCPKAFYSSNDLRRHSRIHSGERPYECKHCGKTFATTISLKTHTFIHTGEKPHRCPHCPKTFATSSKLGRHIVTHSEQRPFACSQCPKTFNRSGDLRRHNLNLHENKVSVASVTENPDSKNVLKVPEPKIENKVPT